MKNKKSKAFTLVELLTVIAIISILTGVSIMGLQEVRKKAQDTSTLASIRELQIALETYKSVNGKYPISPSSTRLSDVVGLAPVYITKIPNASPYVSNARYTSASSGYYYNSNQVSYCLTAAGMINNPDSQKDFLFTESGVVAPKTWVYCSSGYKGD
jgi:prepilin-type N-terminal cleavage/methylation domain-containing protein